MTLFSSIRRAPAFEEKDHDSDDDAGNNEETTRTSSSSSLSSPSSLAAIQNNNNNNQRTPLLLDNEHGGGGGESVENSFSLRIKLNDGKSTIDFSLDGVFPNVTTVEKLKDRILTKHFDDGNDNETRSISSQNNNNRYLRLIVRGRMMAPDTSELEKFSIVPDDVIHAVLAKEGVRGGQQARMLRRLNNRRSSTNSNTTAAPSSYGGSSGSIPPSSPSAGNRMWRRIGIDSNGVVVSPSANENDESDDDEDDESDFEDAHGEIDLEMGNLNSNVGGDDSGNHGNGRQQRRRRRRERRGFDRLRATGMTRDEVTAIRIYFARNVDRYIERRRVMIRASQRLRNSLNDIVNVGSMAGGSSSSSRRQRSRINTAESTNSLLDTEEDSPDDAEAGRRPNSDSNEGGEDANSNNDSGGGVGPGNNNSGNNESSSSSFEGEEILNDRRQMEDEWMSTQGPYSEFRMNLNTSNPLLLAAITGGGAANGAAAGADGGVRGALDRTPAGLFFRSRNTGPAGGGIDGLDEEEEEMLRGALSPNGTFVRNPNGANGGFHPYMGPLPAAGTDKDFVWGFILGFFVGFIMLFWVWMPTVPHKQKIGIISGISFQIGLNLLNKSGGAGGGVL
eukprot:CAMPEP_0181131350 /NCGR_PEP_ID=MMETSP1071-20121207/30377_1 /TAXON_ID=35127 /ORGANISM="Thalassiosira sp., Strain NH16" /LENGTH=617 /DNA_ID=CAMNT_0023217535 /DNA_START=221 /DNA_END=2074 /DNA_ORIENTATION=-